MTGSMSAHCKLRLSPCARRLVQTAWFIVICLLLFCSVDKLQDDVPSRGVGRGLHEDK